MTETVRLRTRWRSNHRTRTRRRWRGFDSRGPRLHSSTAGTSWTLRTCRMSRRRVECFRMCDRTDIHGHPADRGGDGGTIAHHVSGVRTDQREWKSTAIPLRTSRYSSTTSRSACIARWASSSVPRDPLQLGGSSEERPATNFLISAVEGANLASAGVRDRGMHAEHH